MDEINSIRKSNAEQGTVNVNQGPANQVTANLCIVNQGPVNYSNINQGMTTYDYCNSGRPFVPIFVIKVSGLFSVATLWWVREEEQKK